MIKLMRNFELIFFICLYNLFNGFYLFHGFLGLISAELMSRTCDFLIRLSIRAHKKIKMNFLNFAVDENSYKTSNCLPLFYQLSSRSRREKFENGQSY